VLPREGSGEVEAILIPLGGVFCQRPCQYGVEVCEIGSAVRYPRWLRTQMVADDDSAVRIIKGWRAGE
jgi:hypothetical protein